MARVADGGAVRITRRGLSIFVLHRVTLVALAEGAFGMSRLCSFVRFWAGLCSGGRLRIWSTETNWSFESMS